MCKSLDEGEQSEMVGEAAHWSRTEECSSHEPYVCL